MAKFKIPVIWEVTSEIEIDANSLEDALKIFDNEELHGEGYSLPIENEYIDGSFFREQDTDVIKILNNIEIE